MNEIAEVERVRVEADTTQREYIPLSVKTPQISVHSTVSHGIEEIFHREVASSLARNVCTK